MMRYSALIIVSSLLLELWLVSAMEVRGGIIMLQPVAKTNGLSGTGYEIEIVCQVLLHSDTFCDKTTLSSNKVIGNDYLHGQSCKKDMCSYERQVSTLKYYCTDFSRDGNWSFVERKINYTLSHSELIGNATQLKLFFHSCCRAMEGGSWTLSSSLSLLLRNDTGRINSTPRAKIYPVLRLQANCQHRLTIPITDPDGDTVRCRSVGSSECGGMCYNMLNETTCTISYNATFGTGYKGLTLMLEDFGPTSSNPYSSVALQALVYVYTSDEACNKKPSFLYPSYHDSECLVYPTGANISDSLVASSGSSSASVTTFQTLSPRGLKQGPVYSTSGYKVYATNLKWQPALDQNMQTHLFCFEAIASNGLNSDQRCAKFFIGSTAPTLKAVSPNHGLIGLLEPMWRLTFSEKINRPKWQAFIHFINNDTKRVIHSVDTSTSSEIFFSTDLSAMVNIKVNFNFTENSTYYVVLERGAFVGQTGCKPSTLAVDNALTWTFTTNSTMESICDAAHSCSCNQSACGRTLNPPHGTCIFSKCSCYTNWSGADCDISALAPLIDSQPINDTVEEGREYNRTLTIRMGDKPINWRLVEGPTGISVNILNGLVIWRKVKVGVYRIIIEAKNDFGNDRAVWTLVVRPTYHAFLNPVTPAVYSKSTPIKLTGYVEYESGSFIKDLLRSIVPVKVTISRAGASIALLAYTAIDGTFQITYYPLADEYGSYIAAAHHPSGSSQLHGQTKWEVLGMRASPESITLEGEAVSSFADNFISATQIVNDGPSALNDIRTQVISVGQLAENGIQVEPFIRAESSKLLAKGENISLDLRVETNAPISAVFYLNVTSRNGTELIIMCHLTVRPILPRLVSYPSTLHARQPRGSYRTFEFNITNEGDRPASSLEIRLPYDGFLSLVGFGVKADAEGSFALEARSSTIMTLASNVPESLAFGTATYGVQVKSAESQTLISIAIDVSSDRQLDFYVKVADEFTYYTEQKPLVNDAVVKLTNKEIVFQEERNTSQMNGMAVFRNITEGTYYLEVSADNHLGFKQVIVVSAAQLQLTVFLKRSAVKYSWEVKQITIEDRYEITLTAEFETRVPMPVVTIEPSNIDLSPYESGDLDMIQYNVTNHGLIRADGIELRLPSGHPFLAFEAVRSDFGSLGALQSIIISVKVSRRQRTKREVSICFTYAVSVLWTYKCGGIQIRESFAALNSVQFCPSRTWSWVFSGALAPSAGSRGQEMQQSSYQFTFSGLAVNVHCDPCVDSFTSCLTGYLLGLAQPVGCIVTLYNDFINYSTTTIISLVLDVASCIPRISKFKVISKLAGYVSTGLCALDTVKVCLFDKPSIIGRRRRSASRAIEYELMESLYPIIRNLDLVREMLDDPDLTLASNVSWLKALKPAMSAGSEAGEYISESELQTILVAGYVPGTNMSALQHTVERINYTMGNWSKGIFEPSAGENIASYKLISEIWQDIKLYNAKAIAKGFDSYLQAYNYYAAEVSKPNSLEEESGVCAVVKIQLKQDVALTREAFQATLKISNEDTAEISDLWVQLSITDVQDGKLSNAKFHIGEPKQSGELKLASNSRMKLASQASGSADWILMPFSEAAPTVDRMFDIGGRLIYRVHNLTVNISLSPSRITVKPDPSLRVHYFWQKFVQADDPFTIEKEPSIPFCLAVAVKNEGFGSAYDLRITSGKPEIIENEKGLLISFRIIGSSLGSMPRQPSLVAAMGDFAPNETKVVDWWMISSLQGTFTGYSATFLNVNPLGDERLSVLDELKIHDLIKRVRLYNENGARGLLDFLVNARVDIYDIPEIVYSSSDLSTRPVHHGELQFVSQTVTNSSSVILKVITKPAADGWNYYQLRDELGSHRLSHGIVFHAIRQGETSETIPVENAWTQQHAKGSPRTLFSSLHLFDVGKNGSSNIYHIYVCITNCSLNGTSDQFFFDPIAMSVLSDNDTWTYASPNFATSTSASVPASSTSQLPSVPIKPDQRPGSGVNHGKVIRSITLLVAVACSLSALFIRFGVDC